MALTSIVLISNIFASQTIELAGDSNYPPYSYVENGKAKGVYVDILKTAFNKTEKYDIRFNMMAWKKAIALTKAGKVAGFFPPYFAEDRKKWTKFSTPILAETTIVFAKEETLKNKKDYPKDFYGLTACFNRGFDTESVGGKAFAKAIKNKKIKLIEANDNKGCLNIVKRGIADFYINDQLIDTSLFTSIKKGLRVKEDFGYIGFTLKTQKHPYMKDLQNTINNIIEQMKKNGEIERILHTYK
jgi:polar amino acid transport system substrate-binding protein